jgi:hypothetical protein
VEHRDAHLLGRRLQRPGAVRIVVIVAPVSASSRARASSAKLALARRLRGLDGAAFFERDRDPAHSALILGSGRSGTTWLAEALARNSRSRLIFEPFHPIWTPGPRELRLFLAPRAVEPGMQALVERVLSGRTRKRPLGQIVITRLPRARVVKDIHSANLLPWYRSRFPQVPVVFAVRHPIATARSRLRHGDFYGLDRYLETARGRRQAEDSPVAPWLPAYDEHRQDPDELVRGVAEWCIENAYPLRQCASEGAMLVFYERAVREPAAELTRLAEFCAPAIGAGEGLDLETLRRPSAKDFFGTATDADRGRDWDRLLGSWVEEVSADRTRRCLRVLADFGLERHYGEEPLPLAPA